MEGESGLIRSIIDEIHPWDIQGDQMVGESCVTRSIIDQLNFSDIEGDLMGDESGVNRSIIDELHFWDIQADQIEGKVVVLEESLMSFILRILKEIKWKVKVV